MMLTLDFSKTVTTTLKISFAEIMTIRRKADHRSALLTAS